MKGGTEKIGASVGLATSLVQGLQAAKLKKEADAAMPELQDPAQAGMLSELNQKRKSIETGADFATAMQEAEESQAATNDALLRLSGGDTGTAMQALLQSGRNTGAVKNQAIAQGQTQQQFYDNAALGLQNLISARALHLQLLDSQQKRAEWNTKAQARSANFQAGLAKMFGGAKSAATTQPENTVSPQTDNLGLNGEATGPVVPDLKNLKNLNPLPVFTPAQ